MYWTFGYGSLMWDGWEEAYGGTRHEGAVLDSYARAMNKASLKNWGSSTQPGPTMGLERVEGATCVGVAFAVPDHQEEAVRSYLRGREGPSFDLMMVDVQLPDGRSQPMLTAVNDTGASTYLGDVPPNELARMIAGAEGTSGTCKDYLDQLRQQLRAMGIHDDAVDNLWERVRRHSG